MSDGLSYPSLRCVLEYLEANKRIHITARSTLLRQFEKSIPLRMDHLCLGNTECCINYITHEIFDVSKVYFFTKKETRVRALPEGIELLDARRTVKFQLLGGRRDIYVNHLKIDMMRAWESLQLPANLQLKIDKLDTCLASFCDGPLSIVHPSSLPLKMLKTAIENVEDFSHDVLKTASKLTILLMRPQDEPWFITGVASLTNTKIVIKELVHVDGEDRYFRIIQSYLQTPRSIGSHLEIRSVDNYVIDPLLHTLKRRLNGMNVKIKKSIERLSPHIPCSILINSTSAALIYGFNESRTRILYDVKVEIVSTEDFTALTSTR